MKSQGSMAKSPRMRINLSAVVYREEGTWLAHCLEMDIVAEGPTAREAFQDLLDLCDLQIKVALEEGNLDSIFRPAPKEFWRMFWVGEEMPSSRTRPAGQASRSRRKQSAAHISRFVARELALA